MNDPVGPSNHQREGDLLNAALELPAEQRAAFLDRECAGEIALRERLRRLLHAHDRAATFLEGAPMAPTQIEPLSAEVGGWIGRYKLLEKLGEGGWGTVFVAEQTEPLRRRVALKVIKPGMDSRQVIARFEAERQALAMMDHPHIAKVLDAGATAAGHPYFVMELVRGIRITDYCDQNRLDTSQRLNLFVKVCQAVQHAHQKGIIHRDLKPSNILVTLHDGTPVPKVIDFGIAKAIEGRLTDATVYTQLHQFIGTPAYMSPEQAEVSGLDVDTRSDIYSLGVLLYELLVGRTPFDTQALLAAGLDALRRTIREEEPMRPSTRLAELQACSRSSELATRHSSLSTDLDWIVMKCLEKDRARRYETANGLARDLERHLQQEPVSARPPSTAYRLQKFVRRNKPAVAAGASIAAALVLGAVVSLWQGIEARAARWDALHQLYMASLNVVQQDYEQGNLQRMKRLLEETRQHPQRGFEWYYWQRRIHQDVRTFRGHTDVLRGVALSPDGRFVATASARDSAGPNGKLWDVATGRELASFEFPENCRAIASSPDSRRLAVGGTGRMFVWDIGARRELFRFTNRFPAPHGSTNAPVWGLAFSPDGRTLGIGLYQAPAILMVDAETGRVQRELANGKINNTPSLAFSSDGSTLAAVTGLLGTDVGIWEVASGRLLHHIGMRWGQVWQVSFHPSGRQLITAHWDGIARVWNVETGGLEHTLHGPARPLQCALFSPQGDRIYTAGWDEQVRVWDGASFEEIGRLPRGHALGITSMALSRDGRQLLTGSWDGEAKLWDVERLDEPPTFRTTFWPEEHGVLFRFFGTRRGPYATLSSTSNAGLILSLAPSNEVVVADFATQREWLRFATGHRSQVTAFAVAPDLRRWVTAAGDGSAVVWDARQGSKLFTLDGHTDGVNAITFSSDSRRIVTASRDGTARVWDDSGRLLKTLGLGTNTFVGVLSPDSRWIAVGVYDGQNSLWSLETSRPVHPLHHRTGGAFSFTWTADSRRVASAGWDKVVRVWDVASGKLLVECQGHTFPIWSVAFSPDGARLATGSMDHTAKVWDANTGRELLTLAGHEGDVHSVAWSSDGRQVVTCSDDQTMKIWEAATPEEVTTWQAEEAEAARRLVRSGDAARP